MRLAELQQKFKSQPQSMSRVELRISKVRGPETWDGDVQEDPTEWRALTPKILTQRSPIPFPIGSLCLMRVDKMKHYACPPACCLLPAHLPACLPTCLLPAAHLPAACCLLACCMMAMDSNPLEL